jgi:hypothetical protein
MPRDDQWDGGFCAPNQFYTGLENLPAGRKRKHHQG